MKIRLISGSCYIALLIAFFCLKIFIHDYFFDGLVYAFALLGTFEMLRAMKEKTTKAERALVFLFAAVCIPVVAFFEGEYGKGLPTLCVCLIALFVAILSLLVIRYEETTVESVGVSLLSAVYPTVFLALLVLVNHALPIGEEAIEFDSKLLLLFIFVISPCADSIAYVFGRYLKRFFPRKMSPNISPNKTAVGGIGGLVGGVLGAAILYFVYNATAGSYTDMQIWLPVYLAIGLAVSVVTAFGDLTESAIKRKLDIKDMGKIMPGHGGALDRLDGVFFSTVTVYLVYSVIVLFV